MLKKITNILRNRLGSYFLYSKNKGGLFRNKELKNKFKGKRCFIIGNGPTIENQNLLKLKNEKTFVVNTFWNYPQYKQINPKYYVLIDSEVFPIKDKNGKFIQKRGSFFIEELKKHKKIVESCSSKLFFHIKGREFIEENNLFSNNDIYYLAFNGFFNDNLDFNLKIDKPIPNVKNVILASLIIAIHMGFEEIYLLGCEHDFLAHPNHYEGFKHFYATRYNQENPEDVANYALDIMPYEEHIRHVGILFKNYRLVKAKITKTHPQVKIFNATPNSFLDVFPFKKYEDIKFV